MRVALVIALASCTAPSLGTCPSGEAECGFGGPCFDLTTTTAGTCCADFLNAGEICNPYETCDSTTISCRLDAWSLVVCRPGTTASTYRGSYRVQLPNEAVVDDMPAHEYQLRFERGCATIGNAGFTGNATVLFDGTAHAATWTATSTDVGPLTFSGDPTLGLAKIAVRSSNPAGFRGDVTDANGTHAVVFALVN